MSSERMIENFLEYIELDMPPDQTTVGCQPGTRLHRIIRLPNGWRVWIATADYKFGTYLELHDSGIVTHCTVREGEGEEVFMVRPCDDTIRRRLWQAKI